MFYGEARVTERELASAIESKFGGRAVVNIELSRSIGDELFVFIYGDAIAKRAYIFSFIEKSDRRLRFEGEELFSKEYDANEAPEDCLAASWKYSA